MPLGSLRLPFFGIIGGRAMRRYRTLGTIRLAGLADVTAVEDQQVAQECPAVFRDYVGQIELQLYRICVIGQFEAA